MTTPADPIRPARRKPRPLAPGAEACGAIWPGGTRNPPVGWTRPKAARCTRPPRHEGEHQAIGRLGYIYARWAR